MYFSRSGTPSTDIDTSFFADLDIEGYVSESGRGYVSGTASGADSSFDWVVHWYNDEAQYWTYTSSGGSFKSPAMKPGTYTMVFYQGEYVEATSSVSVSAGSTTSKNIAGSVKTGTTIFRIGEWDGQYVIPPPSTCLHKCEKYADEQTNRLPKRRSPTAHASLRRQDGILEPGNIHGRQFVGE